MASEQNPIGIHELLDADGNHKGFPPQPDLWQVRTYERCLHGDGFAYYEEIASV
jgi:hypothetical protein